MLFLLQQLKQINAQEQTRHVLIAATLCGKCISVVEWCMSTVD